MIFFAILFGWAGLLTYSPSARHRASISRKIKAKFGEGAELEAYRKMNVIPPTLYDEWVNSSDSKLKDYAKTGHRGGTAPTKASPQAKAAAKKVKTVKPEHQPSGRGPVKSQLERTAGFGKSAKDREISSSGKPAFNLKDLLKELTNDKEGLKQLLLRGRAGKLTDDDINTLRAAATKLATNDFADDKVLEHYRTGIFHKMNKSPEEVAQFREAYRNGEKIPTWAVPGDTPMSLFQGSDAEPMIVGRMLGHETRKPEQLDANVPFAQFEDSDGKVYEYLDLLMGDFGSLSSQHPAFTAVDSIAKQRSIGKELDVPTSGYKAINFYEGPNQGLATVPDDVYNRILKKMAEMSQLARVGVGQQADIKTMAADVTEEEKGFKTAYARAEIFAMRKQRGGGGGGRTR
jgi:hypothetical protein